MYAAAVNVLLPYYIRPSAAVNFEVSCINEERDGRMGTDAIHNHRREGFMNEEEWTERAQAFDQCVITILAERLAERSDELASGPLRPFTELVTELTGDMFEELNAILKESGDEATDQTHLVEALCLFARGMNRALPRTHPYCVALVEQIESGNASYSINPTFRGRFPSMFPDGHDDFPFIRDHGDCDGPGPCPIASELPSDPADIERVSDIIATFNERILKPSTERFRKRTERLAPLTISTFEPLALSACTRAHWRLRMFSGVKTTEDDPALERAGVFFIARQMNAVLPDRFPYCIGFIASRGEDHFQFIIIEQSHDINVPMALREQRVPVISADNSYITFVPERRGLLRDMEPPLLS
jgi:hypothetical protein